jgi:voltage-gated potassium channel
MKKISMLMISTNHTIRNTGRKFELFVTIITALSVIMIIGDYLYKLSADQKLAMYIFDFVVVVILAVDFYSRMRASGQGLRFILKHWYEIPAMLPLFAFSLIESYIVVGAAARTLRLIRLFRLIHLFFRATTIFAHTKFLYMLVFTSSAIIIGAIGEYIVESPVKDTKITTIGDALWWAVETATTVSYGDLYPVTIEGKFIAAAVMILGMASLGIFISTIGVSLIESRLKEKGRGNDDNNNYTKPRLADDTKLLIKNKIDDIENLTLEDVNTLMAMIMTLHSNLYKAQTDHNQKL